MTWVDKELVEGTNPPIRIGRRTFRSSDGTIKATTTYWATFSYQRKQRFRPLKVFTREDAIREVWKLVPRIQAGEARFTSGRIKLGQIVDAYLNLLRGRGRAAKTMQKYAYVLKTLDEWWNAKWMARVCTSKGMLGAGGLRLHHSPC